MYKMSSFLDSGRCSIILGRLVGLVKLVSEVQYFDESHIKLKLTLKFNN